MSVSVAMSPPAGRVPRDPAVPGTAMSRVFQPAFRAGLVDGHGLRTPPVVVLTGSGAAAVNGPLRPASPSVKPLADQRRPAGLSMGHADGAEGGLR